LTRMHCILVFDERSSDIVTIVTMCKVAIPSNTHCSDGCRRGGRGVVERREAQRDRIRPGGGWLIRRPRQERLFQLRQDSDARKLNGRSNQYSAHTVHGARLNGAKRTGFTAGQEGGQFIRRPQQERLSHIGSVHIKYRRAQSFRRERSACANERRQCVVACYTVSFWRWNVDCSIINSPADLVPRH
jgi:hypothetical protein